jgi:glycosyltransferase involved in cell wall biosynthesis
MRNESATIVSLVQRVRAVDCGMPKELIVVDDFSTDGSRELATELAANLPDVKAVLKDVGRGKGHAVRTGFDLASGDIVIIQDADLELDPAQIPTLLAPILSGETNVVFGSRFKRGRGKKTWLWYFGNTALTWAVNIGYGGRLTDMLTGYKVMRTEVMRSLELTCDGFDLDAEITCQLLRRGERIVEVPISYIPRGMREGKKLHLSATWPILWAIIRTRFVHIRPNAAPEPRSESSKTLSHGP